MYLIVGPNNISSHRIDHVSRLYLFSSIEKENFVILRHTAEKTPVDNGANLFKWEMMKYYKIPSKEVGFVY